MSINRISSVLRTFSRRYPSVLVNSQCLVPRYIATSTRSNAIQLPLYNCVGSVRLFKSTAILNAKGKKKGKAAADVEEEGEDVLPSSAEMSDAMDSRLAHLNDEYSKLHGGKNSADMFSHLQVSAYGSQMSLGEAGQATLKGGNKLTINCYDPAIVKAVADSIRDCGMSLNPSVEGGSVVVMIPKASAEARAEVVKLAAKAAEKVKQEIRQIRKVTLDAVKALKGKVSEDDSHKVAKEIDVITEKKVDAVTAAFKAKEKDITTA